MNATQLGIGSFKGSSPARILMQNNWDVAALRTNDLLREDEWKAMDDVVVQVARTRLGAIDDLRSAGLTRALGGLGVLIDQYEQVSDIDAAEQSMMGVTEGQRDQAEFTLKQVPVPITFRDFQFHLRQLEASRRGNSAIDMTNAELAARVVAEKLEATLFLGSTVKIDGATLYGYTNHPNRITGSLSGTGWAGTGDAVADVIAMIAAAEAQNYFGPFMLYVPVAYNAHLRTDVSASYGKTKRERLLEIDSLSGIRGTSNLTGNSAVLVQMTRDVVDLAVAQDITTVQWEDKGGFVSNFKVMAAIAPRVKDTAAGATGVVHYTV